MSTGLEDIQAGIQQAKTGAEQIMYQTNKISTEARDACIILGKLAEIETCGAMQDLEKGDKQ